MTGKSRVRQRPDEGAYAILFAILIVVLFGLSAIVVDFASVRQDRRLDRSTTDSAAAGGAEALTPGSTPQAACLRAWDFLKSSLQLKPLDITGTPCAKFAGLSLSYCTTVNPPVEIPDPINISGNRQVIVAWPLPSGSSFLKPDLAPGAATQNFSTPVDGTAAGCDRLGVAILEDERLGLGAIFGATGTHTQVHSVARVVSRTGSLQELAALNVLNTTDCQTLSTGGQGDIIVNSATDGSRGVIAVESDASGCPNTGNKFVIDQSTNANNLICAAGAGLVGDIANISGTCTGRIEQHALDGTSCSLAYPGASSSCTGTPSVPLAPRPTPEEGIFGWNPVTSVYGCKTLTPVASVTAEQACNTYPSYMRDLITQYDVDGTSTTITPYQGINKDGSAGWGQGAFRVIPGKGVNNPLPGFTCAPSNFYIPPGNWYVDCPDKKQVPGFSPSNTVIFGGGHIIFGGSISASSNPTCLAFNAVETVSPPVCPTVTDIGSATASISPGPDPNNPNSIVFVRGSLGISTGANGIQMYLPQTTVVQAGSGLLAIGGGANSTSRLFWSAPGARTGGVTQLKNACTVGSTTSQACLDSHFEKIAYWNETQTSTKNQIGGQGSLGLVGVFFTPRSPMEFGGQAGFAATAAQFWADKLSLGGQGNLVMSPDAANSIFRPAFSVALIR